MAGVILLLSLMLILGSGIPATQAILGRTSLVPVQIHPDKQVAVRAGQNLTIMCDSGLKIQSCRFEIPGEGSLLLKKGQSSDDGIEYAGDGYESGQCGVHFRSVKESYDGNVTCSLTPEGGRSESQNSVRLIVARPPDTVQLFIQPLHADSNVFNKLDTLKASCIAEGGRPKANLSIYLGDEMLGHDEVYLYGSAYLQNDHLESSRAIKNVTHVLQARDNGKILRCLADHIALDSPLQDTMEIRVNFPPEEPSGKIKNFGYVIGRPGKINVTVIAEPKPRLTWQVGNEFIEEGMKDTSMRLHAEPVINLGKGVWSTVLTIDSVQRQDTEKTYFLIAENSRGKAIYEVSLSTSADPGFGGDAGTLVGIVVGVLLLILVLCIAVFARATGRWCFADKSGNRAEGDANPLPKTQRPGTKETSSTPSSTWPIKSKE